MAALTAGKHVLREKPLATTAADTARTVAAAGASGRRLVEGFMYRHHPQTRLAHSLVAEGTLGRVTGIRAALSVEVPEDDIRRSETLGGGASLDLGCYCVHAIRTFGGEPEEVFACRVPDRGSDVVDVWLAAVLQVPGGALGHFDVGLDLPRRDQLEVVGTQGRSGVPDPWICRTGSVVLERDGHRETLPADPDGRYGLTGQETDAYHLEFATVSAQLSGAPQPSGPVSGRGEAAGVVHQAAVLDAIRRAATTRTPVRPEQQRDGCSAMS